MTVRQVFYAVSTALVIGGLLTIAPTSGRAQETIVLPEKGGPITLVGCFQRMKIANEGDKFVLVKPTLGPATTVPEATCTATRNQQMVELDDVHTNVHEHHLDRSKVGRWIEITGRLEKAGHQALREVHVDSYRIVPVAAPVAAAVPAPKPPAMTQPAAPAPPLPAEPMPTAGVHEELPQTASSLPLIAVIGFLALTGGLAFSAYRRTARRG